MQADTHQVVLTTTGSEQDASTLATGLVERGLAACVQIVGPVRSIYCWEGEIRDDQEWQCWIKTSDDRFDELVEWIEDNHGYDVPEVIAVPVTGGSTDYLAWVSAQTRR